MLTSSKLGFGLMRLPRAENGQIDQTKMAKMVDEYLEKGFTYFDTAYVYEGSEEAAKEALVKRHPRSSFTIASKLPAWEIKREEDKLRIFNETCSRLGVDFVDFYLLHAVSRQNIGTYDKFGCWEFLSELKKEGKIRHMGFSFHDSPELLNELLTKHPEVEFVQLQINYLDWEDPVVCSRRIYEVATKHSVPIVVMEPVKGGRLAFLPKKEKELYEKDYPSASAASFALRFVASLPNVMTVLSGMSNEEQMKDNLSTFSSFVPFTSRDHELKEQIISGIRGYDLIPCTECEYCMEGCPKHVPIPELFSARNDFTLYGDKEKALSLYRAGGEGVYASACISCGKCERVCPQHISIRRNLKEIQESFGF